jgi:hypothetical protein
MDRTIWTFSAPLSASPPNRGLRSVLGIRTGVTVGGRLRASARQPVTGRFVFTGVGVGAGLTVELGVRLGEGEEVGDGGVVLVAVDEGVGTVTVMDSDPDLVAVLAGAGEVVLSVTWPGLP